jgi:hypothetical protein
MLPCALPPQPIVRAVLLANVGEYTETTIQPLCPGASGPSTRVQAPPALLPGIAHWLVTAPGRNTKDYEVYGGPEAAEDGRHHYALREIESDQI